MSEFACPFPSPLFSWTLQVPPGQLAAVLDKPDALQAAIELGRLDLASLLISLVGVLLAIFGLLGFFEVRNGAKRAAREAAREEAKLVLPSLLPNLVRDVLKKEPEILTNILRQEPALMVIAMRALVQSEDALFGDIDADEAEDIASKMGE